ncbi:MAG: 50S ribosomal protein L21 [Oligoflexales bacterium]
MYAVIRTGGHQYRVREGEVLKVSKLPGEDGGQVSFDDVLMLGEGKELRVGKPTLEGVRVSGTIKAQYREPKITIFKFRRRKNSKTTRGHRQHMTVVTIDKIHA